MPAVAEVDEIDKYLEQVFGRLADSPLVANEQYAYRIMRAEMEDKIRTSVQQQEEVGYSRGQAVGRVLTTLKDSHRVRQQVIYKAHSYTRRLRSGERSTVIPEWRHMLNSNGGPGPALAYLCILNEYAKTPYASITGANLLALVPFMLGLVFAALRSWSTRQKRPNQANPLFLLFLWALILVGGVLPVASPARFLLLGVFCGEAGSAIWQLVYAVVLKNRRRV